MMCIVAILVKTKRCEKKKKLYFTVEKKKINSYDIKFQNFYQLFDLVIYFSESILLLNTV